MDQGFALERRVDDHESKTSPLRRGHDLHEIHEYPNVLEPSHLYLMWFSQAMSLPLHRRDKGNIREVIWVVVCVTGGVVIEEVLPRSSADSRIVTRSKANQFREGRVTTQAKLKQEFG